MNKTLLTFAITVAMVASVVSYPARAYAFWPFTFGMSTGQVLGTESESKGGFFGAVQGFLKKFRSTEESGEVSRYRGVTGPSGERPEKTRSLSGASGSVGLMIPVERLNQAVTDGKITETQKTEILSRLEAIRSKQQELVSLQQSLKQWFVDNKVQTSVFAPSQQMMQGNTKRMPPRGMMGQTESGQGEDGTAGQN